MDKNSDWDVGLQDPRLKDNQRYGNLIFPDWFDWAVDEEVREINEQLK